MHIIALCSDLYSRNISPNRKIPETVCIDSSRSNVFLTSPDPSPDVRWRSCLIEWPLFGAARWGWLLLKRCTYSRSFSPRMSPDDTTFPMSNSYRQALDELALPTGPRGTRVRDRCPGGSMDENKD